ncbi:MAG: MATE family efflux transporter [Planctomycetes bacterium]|nr:MATE family efflux transporter [Planctomycetota bacterium]
MTEASDDNVARTGRREFRDLVALAAPIMVVQIGMMSMGLVDTAMLGRVSSDDVAACGLGNSFSYLVANFCMGILFALDPILSQALGARDNEAFANGLRNGFVVALLLTIPGSVAWWFSGDVLHALEQPARLIPKAESYVRALIPSLFAFFGFIVLRISLQAMHRIRPLIVIILAANVANAVLDVALIEGKFGLPALGIVGCGIATTICRWAMFLGLAACAWPHLRPAILHRSSGLPSARALWRIVRYGVPIGLQLVVELGAFVVVMFRMGYLENPETAVAGHVIAINLAALSFMMPLGLSIAASVRVGWAVGEGDIERVRQRARIALVTGAAIMAVWGVFFWLTPAPLLRVFTDDPAVLTVALTLMPLAALFQIFDGLQVVAGGVLRGLGDTLLPALCHILGFWLLGLPVGRWLAFDRGLGPSGLWWGLVLGLVAVSIVLIWRMERCLRRNTIRRI